MKRLHVHVSVESISERDRLLLGAVRGAARGDEAGLRQMDARRSARELRDLDARPRAGPRSSRHPGRERRTNCTRSMRGCDRRAATSSKQGQTTCCYAKSEKSWIDDPAGISWETFHTTGESTIYGDGTGERRRAASRMPKRPRAARRSRRKHAAALLREPDETVPYNVLFLCTGNSARSIIAEAILNKLGAGKFQRLLAPAASPRARSIRTRSQLLQGLGYDTSGFRSKSWSEFAKPGAPRARFRVHRLRQRGGRSLPVLAGPADDRALGRARSRRSHRQRRPRSRSPSRTPTACCTSASRSSPRCRSGASTSSACRPGCRRSAAWKARPPRRKPSVMPTLAQRALAEALGTAFLLATVVGSGIMARAAVRRERRARAARQHAADRRDPGGADPDLRAGVGRAFQSGGQRRVRAARRDRLADRGALHRVPDRRRRSPASGPRT